MKYFFLGDFVFGAMAAGADIDDVFVELSAVGAVAYLHPMSPLLICSSVIIMVLLGVIQWNAS